MKTTLLNHLLTVGGEQYDIAVLVNDVGKVNVDADLIESGSDLSMDDGGVTELSNGCICCGLQNELDQERQRLVLDEEFDYLVIEASGISDPVPIAQRFVSPATAGFGEAFRWLSWEEVRTRVVSTRATAGIARNVPVFVLPGSENAVRLATTEIIANEAPFVAGLATRHLVGETNE